MNSSRREFMKWSLAGAGTLLLSDLWPRNVMAAPPVEDPHFFLQIVMNGGADNSYLFDARPLSMTKAGIMQNYTGVDPISYQAANGGSCLVSVAAKDLFDYRDDLCILNGVMMATSFDGHDQNMNYLFTGNPFGGASFVPHINEYSSTHSKRPLDVLQNGFLYASLQNTSRTVALDPKSTKSFSDRLSQIPLVNADSELSGFIAQRMKANAQGTGRMAMGSRQLLDGYLSAADLQEKFRKLNVDPFALTSDPVSDFMNMLIKLYKNDITRSAVWVLEPFFDTHGAIQAKTQPDMFKQVSAQIAQVMKFLKSTPYDGKRSYLDVTTLMVSTEFGRSMRQKTTKDISETGTDHNAFNNSVILAGKGIKTGQVIGASDYQDEKAKVSGAHQFLDPSSLKIVGCPFDFKKSEVRKDLPAQFDINDYLTIGSVVNTLYRLFNVPNQYDRLLGRAGSPAAPMIQSLLK